MDGKPVAEVAARATVLVRTTRLLARSLESLSGELERDLAGLTEPGTGVRAEAEEPLLDALRAENQQLREALEGRGIIERAKGMLMILHDCDEDMAFRMLVALSQRRQRKVRDVAGEVVAAAGEARRNGVPVQAVASGSAADSANRAERASPLGRQSSRPGRNPGQAK